MRGVQGEIAQCFTLSSFWQQSRSLSFKPNLLLCVEIDVAVNDPLDYQAQLPRWLRGVAHVVQFLRASFSGHGFEGLPAIGPGKKLIEFAVWMPVDDPRQYVGEIGERIGAAQTHTVVTGGNDRCKGSGWFAEARKLARGARALASPLRLSRGTAQE
jgi:hypothetical protein